MLWLFGEAAWKPRGQANRFGSIHNERGQWATTHRELVNEWCWSKGKVGRFLAELKADGTIALDLVKCGAKSRAENGAGHGYARTLITLLNYDRFNGALRAVGQRVGQKVGQQNPELPGLIYEIASKPNKQANHIKESSPPKWKDRPPHGKHWKGLVFLHHPSVDWHTAAKDFEDVRGTPIFPRRYRDGWGNWFVSAGEAMREPWQATG